MKTQSSPPGTVSRRISPIELTSHAVERVPSSALNTDQIALDAGRSWTGHARMEVEQSSGTKTQSNLFYWLFTSQSAELYPACEAPIPLVIWLNGGPGASSLCGLFLENGPFRALSDPAVSVVPNPAGWDQSCHLLYWDQPVGTGFSTTNNDKEGLVGGELELSRQFCTALEMFFASPAYKAYRECPLYIVGESYAGKYVPSIATHLIAQRAQYPHTPPLSGIAIGDGWMIPGWQTEIQVDYGYAMGFVDTKQYLDLKSRCVHLQKLIDCGEMVEANQLGTQITADLVAWGGTPDIYDVRTFAQTSTTALAAYFDSPGLQSAINVDGTWQNADNAGPVTEALASDVYASAKLQIVELLRHARDTDFRALFYTGDFDMSCGFLGTERMLYDLNYPDLTDGVQSESDWRSLDRRIWQPGSNPLGYVKALGNLAQVTVIGAGHLVPMNRPVASREMIYNWIFERPFPTRVSSAP